MRVELELPEGEFVTFTEGGGGQPNRLIIQFKNMNAMHAASETLALAIEKRQQEYIDYREKMDALG